MLTTIRRSQKWLLILVCIVIVVSFSLYTGFDSAGRGALSPGTAFCVYKKCYTPNEASRLASYHSVAQAIGLYDFARSLFGEQRLDQDRTNFVLSLVVLRHEAEKLGISPTNEEVVQAYQDLPIFQSPMVTPQMVKERIMGPAGFTQTDEVQLMKDYLSWKQIRELLTAGIASTPDEIDRRYKQLNRQFTSHVINFDRSKFQESVNVSDDEVKTYFTEHEGEILTEEARAFEYVKIEMPALAEDATNEAKADARQAHLKKINDLYLAAVSEDKTFAEAVNEAGLKLETAGPFPRTEPSEALKSESALLDTVFSRTVSMVKPIPVPVQVEAREPTSSFYMLNLTEVVEPRPQTLEEATDVITDVLTRQKADQAVKEAAQSAQAKINEALAGGQSLEAAAKAAGVEAVAVPQFSVSNPPAATEDAGAIVGAAQSLSEGELSTVLDRSRGAGYMLLYIDDIVLFEDEEMDIKKDMLARETASIEQNRIFNAWFRKVLGDSGAARSQSVEDIERARQAAQQAAEEV